MSRRLPQLALALAATTLVASAARAEAPVRQPAAVDAAPVDAAPAEPDPGSAPAQPPDPSRTRYFYAPNAMLLHRGEVVFSQRELLYSEVDAGLTDHLSLLVGAALPFWMANGGFNFVGALKAGGSIGPNLHLAVGAESFVLPELGAFGFFFGSTTIGNDTLQATLSMGKPFGFTNNSGTVGDAIAVVAASARVSEHVALMTENWIFPGADFGEGLLPFIGSAGVRLMSGAISGDVGFVDVAGVPVPMPWVNFTYRMR